MFTVLSDSSSESSDEYKLRLSLSVISVISSSPINIEAIIYRQLFILVNRIMDSVCYSINDWWQRSESTSSFVKFQQHFQEACHKLLNQEHLKMLNVYKKLETLLVWNTS